MKSHTRAAAAGALLMLAAQPCFAADEMRELSSERRTAAFAGAAVKLPLNGRTGAKPTARLQLGMRHIYQEIGNRSAANYRQIGLLELGGNNHGNPQLFIGGQSTRAIDKKLGLLGGTGTLLLLGGVALGAFAAITLLDDNDTNAKPAN